MRDAFKDRTRQENNITIIKAVLGLLSGGVSFLFDKLIEIGIVDLSEIGAIGAWLFTKGNVDQWNALIAQGKEVLKAKWDQGIDESLKKLGFDPEELFHIWLNSPISIPELGNEEHKSLSRERKKTPTPVKEFTPRLSQLPYTVWGEKSITPTFSPTKRPSSPVSLLPPLPNFNKKPVSESFAVEVPSSSLR